MLVFVEVQVALCLFVLGAQDAIGRGELGHDQAAAAQVANEAAEDGVRDASHGSKDGRGTDLDRANLQQLWNARGQECPRHTGIFRVVPVLAHLVIVIRKAKPLPKQGL